MSWSTIAVPGAVQVVPVTAAGFTTRGSRASRVGIVSPKAAVAERRMVTSAEVYMAAGFGSLKG
jgi:hypothetical protein